MLLLSQKLPCYFDLYIIFQKIITYIQFDGLFDMKIPQIFVVKSMDFIKKSVVKIDDGCKEGFQINIKPFDWLLQFFSPVPPLVRKWGAGRRFSSL